MPVRRPQHRRQLRHQDRVDDRVEARKLRASYLDLNLFVYYGDATGARLFVAHHRDRVERLTSLLDGAEDRARGVIAPDPVKPVGNLPLPLAIHDHDQVEHARRRKRPVGGVPLAQQLPECGFDLVGRGVPL